MATDSCRGRGWWTLCVGVGLACGCGTESAATGPTTELDATASPATAEASTDGAGGPTEEAGPTDIDAGADSARAVAEADATTLLDHTEAGATAPDVAASTSDAREASNTSDAPLVCTYDDAGRLPAEAKACATDSDCTFLPTYTCCGASIIVGLAKNAPAYRSCFSVSPPQGCGNLGCASVAQTEDQQQAPFAPINLIGVSVHCVGGDGGARRCMTRYDPGDGG